MLIAIPSLVAIAMGYQPPARVNPGLRPSSLRKLPSRRAPAQDGLHRSTARAAGTWIPARAGKREGFRSLAGDFLDFLRAEPQFAENLRGMLAKARRRRVLVGRGGREAHGERHRRQPAFARM